MFVLRDIGTVKRWICLAALFLSIQPPFVLAKFGEVPPVKGQVKCCFQKGGGILSGRCLEMSESDCALKKGTVVKDCKDCGEQEGDKQKKR